MTKWLIGLGLIAVAVPAFAQPYPSNPSPYGGGGGAGFAPQGGYLPNYYNRQNQPLSPYLNLLRGGNPGVNYFFGVRPGVQSTAPGFGQGAFPIGGTSPLRTGFLPAAANPSSEPIELPAAGQPILSLSPSGHPVSFGRTGMSFPGGGASAAGWPGVLGNRPQGQGTTPKKP